MYFSLTQNSDHKVAFKIRNNYFMPFIFFAPGYAAGNTLVINYFRKHSGCYGRKLKHASVVWMPSALIDDGIMTFSVIEGR